MFRIGAEIFGNHKVCIQNFKASSPEVKLSILVICCYKSKYMYEYSIESETPLSELETSLTAKKLEPSARLIIIMNLDWFQS